MVQPAEFFATLRDAATAHDAAIADIWRKLDPLLERVADALAELSDGEWQVLCKEERATVTTTLQYLDFAGGVPETMIPELVIGERVLELFTARHPLRVRDPEGEA